MMSQTFLSNFQIERLYRTWDCIKNTIQIIIFHGTLTENYTIVIMKYYT